MMKRVVAIVLLILQFLSLNAQNVPDYNNQIQIEGTELAQLQSVMDILVVLPGVSIVDDVITLTGQGTPAIYIDNRKITELSELLHITGDKVKEIEIMRHPGAEYEKNVEAVIVIRLKPNNTEGFSLDNTLRFDVTNKISPHDELTLGWKRKKLTLGTFIGWHEEQRYFQRTIYSNKYQDHKLISENNKLVHPNLKRQWLSSRFSVSYDINAHNKITCNYSFYNKYKDLTTISENSQITNNLDEHHDFSLEYTGRIKQWNIVIGNNSFIDNADLTIETPTKTSYYIRKEYDLRTYAKMFRNFWKGSVMLGAEHDLDHMNVKMYEDNPSYDPLEKIYFNTHAIHPDNTIGVFATTTQNFGRWNIETGLRYENHNYVYRPCNDDGLMRFLDDFEPIIDYDIPEEYYLIPFLIKNREVGFKNDYLYPSLKISTELGDSELSFKHSENSVRPYLGITRLRFSEIELMNEKILKTEKASATSLEWKYKWAILSASYTYYDDPICKTLSSANQYNAPDYDAVDFDIALAPQIICWYPMLHIHFHKQWFEMPLASGKDRLLEPFTKITFNNTVTLPHELIIRLNALWHSRGAERNTYYYSTDFRLDASIQKSLLKQKLTFVINVVNILRGSYNDITCYVQEFYSLTQGICDRNTRTFSLMVRYKL